MPPSSEREPLLPNRANRAIIDSPPPSYSEAGNSREPAPSVPVTASKSDGPTGAKCLWFLLPFLLVVLGGGIFTGRCIGKQDIRLAEIRLDNQAHELTIQKRDLHDAEKRLEKRQEGWEIEIERQERYLGEQRRSLNARVVALDHREHVLDEKAVTIQRERDEWDTERRRKNDEERRDKERKERIDLKWAGLTADAKCLSYGSRNYWARLENLPLDVDRHAWCMGTSIDIHGVSYQRPNACTVSRDVPS